MLELQIIAGAKAMPIFDLPAALGRANAAREVGDTIDALMAFLDDLDGDPDLEEPGNEDSFLPHRAAGPGCPIADAGGTEREDEDDDPDTGVEDHPRGFDPEEDHDDSDREQDDGDCGIDAQQIDPTARRRHRDRVRATACDVTIHRNRFNGRVYRDYRLRDPRSIAINI